jgi:predicted secreted hydrolase
MTARGGAWAAAAIVLFLLGPGRAAGPAAETDPYRVALPGYRYAFPRDHFEHPDFRTEWWYYTGNLRDDGGRRFGFELVFFRRGQSRDPVENPSAWRIDDLFLAHVALTDIDGNRFYNHQRLNRAGPGIAGASFAERRVWNGNWSVAWQGDHQTLEATADEFSLRIELSPVKPPVIHGIGGVSQKAAGPGRASYYLSLPRLSARGHVLVGCKRHDVTGTAWMDHEWFTNQMAKDQIGWDWFSIQLENQTELMLFQLRHRDGSIDPYSSGTYVDREGRARHLARGEISLEPERHWRSPKTGAAYPVSWRIRVPALGIELVARAALDAQELTAGNETGPNYWEGAVAYSGSVNGIGYLEMTGYDKPIRLE